MGLPRSPSERQRPDISTTGRAGKRKARKGKLREQQQEPGAKPDWGFLNECFAHIDGFSVSREAKRKQREAGIFKDGLQYGEVDIGSIIELLTGTAVKLEEGETFVDVGSGTGKAVLAAAATVNVARSFGLEVVPELHECSVQALARFRQQGMAAGCGEVEFKLCDAFAPESIAEWTMADVMLVTTTCLTPTQIDTIVAAVVERGREGSRLIVTTSTLPPDSRLHLVEKKRRKYGKGSLNFICYRLRGSPTGNLPETE